MTSTFIEVVMLWSLHHKLEVRDPGKPPPKPIILSVAKCFVLQPESYNFPNKVNRSRKPKKTKKKGIGLLMTVVGCLHQRR